MNATATGRIAEDAVAEYLKKLGHRIVEQNWRTRYCEIDIVSEKDKTAYFVEVKYRRGNAQGAGFDYITPTKLKQMRFAAELWVHATNWQGAYAIAAAEVSGSDYRVSAFINDIL